MIEGNAQVLVTFQENSVDPNFGYVHVIIATKASGAANAKYLAEWLRQRLIGTNELAIERVPSEGRDETNFEVGAKFGAGYSRFSIKIDIASGSQAADPLGR